ncbi:MAG: HAMP domain-containing histidine kinase [Oligoflexales bacterium]|nr:HAMP domain-containing histidine kinase [Oligoflexales bacterium]
MAINEHLSWSKRHLSKLKFARIVLHPVFIFVSLQVLLISLIVLWIIWFFESQQELSKLKSALGQTFRDDDFFVVVLIIGISFLAYILIGTALLFATLIKQRRLNRQQNNFLSSVSHELRSPLASIQLSLDTITTRQLDKDTLFKLINMMQLDRQRLSKLVEQILLSARLEIGKMQLEEHQNVNLNSYLLEVCLESSYMDSNLSKRLSIDCAKDVELVVPKIALQFIISNLIENAIKYSPPSSPIQLHAEISKRWLILTFIDQGFGIDKKDQKLVFKMFQRADSTLKKAIPGTGLGLFIVKSITKALGGKITLFSAGVNKGSTFIVNIPCKFEA